MATTTTEPRNWTYLAGKTIAAGFAIGALAASYTHIVHLFNMLGLHGWQAFTAPAFIDGFAALGLLGRNKCFADYTRRTGMRIQIVATVVSFIANVVAGETWGGRIFGAMVVVGYIVAEMFVDRMHAAPTKADAAKTVRSQAAVKAAATRAANKAKAVQAAPRKKVAAPRKAKAIAAAPKTPAAVLIGSEPAYI